MALDKNFCPRCGKRTVALDVPGREVYKCIDHGVTYDAALPVVEEEQKPVVEPLAIEAEKPTPKPLN